MAITLVTRMWSKDTSGINNRGGKTWKVRAREAFMATGNDPVNDDELDVLAHSDIPTSCSYWNGTQVGVANRSVERIGPTTWICTVDYQGETMPGSLTQSAISAPATLEWGDVSSTETVDTDVYGFPIVNTIGESLDGVQMEISDLTLTATRNFASFSPAGTHAYRHSVNSDTFMGFSPGVCRLTGFSAKEKFDSSCGGYWEVSAQFTFRYAWRGPAYTAWMARVRNEGYYERKGATVTITGDGLGATAVAYINPSDGSISGIQVTNMGTGYSNATVTISDPTGVASPASATANINSNGLITSITVDTAGSDYVSFKAPIRDGEGSPVNRPFLLDAAGRKLENSNNALWLYYQKYQSLPYNSLGIV